ncbi:YciI family protein [Spirillospora sp. NPDC047279]|uniref:YciI family protein n=1 Tax=Spirillospora sp. NPDC047279 TaxID=3155478 RepID=UPI0033D3A9A8
MIIIYGNQELWDSFTPDEWKQAVAEQDAFNQKFKDSGELLGAFGTGDVEEARTVRVRDGIPAVTDGPYLETKEYLASWCLIEVPSEERALEIAAEVPHARLRAVEVWPIRHEASWARV